MVHDEPHPTNQMRSAPNIDWSGGSRNLGRQVVIIPKLHTIYVIIIEGITGMPVNIAPDLTSTYPHNKSTNNAARSRPSTGGWVGDLDRDGKG